MDLHWQKYKQEDFYYTNMGGTCMICKCKRSFRQGMYQNYETTTRICTNCFYKLAHREEVSESNIPLDIEGNGSLCLGCLVIAGLLLWAFISLIIEAFTK